MDGLQHPSSVIIHVHQNRAIVYNVYQHENVCINSKSQYIVPKTKWEGAGGANESINNFFKIDNR